MKDIPTPTLEGKIEELNIAKKNVITLIAEPDASVDFHGLAYWAKQVEDLRELIRKSL